MSIEASNRPSPAVPPAAPGRSASDWIGFLYFLGTTISVFLRGSFLPLLMLPTLLHDTLTAFSFLMRRRARARIASLPARMAAYGATFAVPIFFSLQGLCRVEAVSRALARYAPWFPQAMDATSSHTWQRAIWVVAWCSGTLLCIWALWNLRYAFSIEPQARKLVCTGPYRLARHPVYLSYLLQYAAVFTVMPNRTFGAVLLIWAALSLVRVHYEEKVLRATFPEYEQYRREVGMLWPRFTRTSTPAVSKTAAYAGTGGAR